MVSLKLLFFMNRFKIFLSFITSVWEHKTLHMHYILNIFNDIEVFMIFLMRLWLQAGSIFVGVGLTVIFLAETVALLLFF